MRSERAPAKGESRKNTVDRRSRAPGAANQASESPTSAFRFSYALASCCPTIRILILRPR